MNKSAFLFTLGLWLLWLQPACFIAQPDEKLSPYVPAHFPAPHYVFQDSIDFGQAFELGKQLFFDPILSVNNTISCGSCHIPFAGFSDSGKTLSVGIEGQLSKRNSPALFNLAWHTSFMWDGGINHIEVMPIAPITDPNEMGEELSSVIKKLKNHPEYKTKFKQLYGIDSFSTRELMLALTAYMIQIVSDKSPFDEFAKGERKLSHSEQKGFEIFNSKCNHCHTAPLFTDFSFKNNGMGKTENEIGRALITLKTEEEGKFKVPSLRNISLSYPYMHNGSLNTIDDVLAFYLVAPSLPHTDSFIKNNRLILEDIEPLKAFLELLKDPHFVSTQNLEPK